MTYCDSSFLIALFVVLDEFHGQAVKAARKFAEAIPYPLLAELELTNGIRRVEASGRISRTEHDRVFRHIAADEMSGILARPGLNQGTHYAKARKLSKRHTCSMSCRSLDTLHVAAALILGSKFFASFDERQRKLAAVEGMTLIPQNIKSRT
jgi:predicted nucleic acid-binding protein